MSSYGTLSRGLSCPKAGREGGCHEPPVYHALVSASPAPQPVTILAFLVLYVYYTLTSELSVSCQDCHCSDLQCSRFLSQGFATALQGQPYNLCKLLSCAVTPPSKSILPLGVSQPNPVYPVIPVLLLCLLYLAEASATVLARHSTN